MTVRGFYAACTLDHTPSGRKSRATPMHPCQGGCGGDVKAGSKRCPPCSDIAQQENRRIRNGVNRARGRVAA